MKKKRRWIRSKKQIPIITLFIFAFGFAVVLLPSSSSDWYQNATLESYITLISHVAVIIFSPIFIYIYLQLEVKKAPMPKYEPTKINVLKPSEWVQFLVTKQNQIETSYYSSKQSTFSLFILILAMMSIIVALSSIMTFLIDKEAIAIIIVRIALGMKFLLFALVAFLSYHLAKEMKGRGDVEEIEQLIDEIIEGKLKKYNEIKKRYMEIRR